MPGLNWRPLPCQGSALPLRQPPEVETGFEPVYTDLQSVASPLGHSTVLLRADDGIRTRDPHLGKVMLYQLSHVRVPLNRCGLDHSGWVVPGTNRIGWSSKHHRVGAGGGCQGPPGPRRWAWSPYQTPQQRCATPPRSAMVSQVRAYGAAVARFVHTEEVTGSNPVTPTDAASVTAS